MDQVAERVEVDEAAPEHDVQVGDRDGDRPVQGEVQRHPQRRREPAPVPGHPLARGDLVAAQVEPLAAGDAAAQRRDDLHRVVGGRERRAADGRRGTPGDHRVRREEQRRAAAPHLVGDRRRPVDVDVPEEPRDEGAAQLGPAELAGGDGVRSAEEHVRDGRPRRPSGRTTIHRCGPRHGAIPSPRWLLALGAAPCLARPAALPRVPRCRASRGRRDVPRAVVGTCLARLMVPCSRSGTPPNSDM